jgi:hypothetical protein
LTEGFTIQALLTFILYLAFFGWIGFRRGSWREFIVLTTSVLGWLILQEQGDIFVRVANLGSKFTAFITAGGLSENPDEAFSAISDAPPWVTSTTRNGYLFLIWVVLVILAYMLTGWLVPSEKSQSNGWAILWGILNGLFFASVFLPRLLFLFAPNATLAIATAAPDGATSDSRANIVTFLRTGFDLIWELIRNVWVLLQPFQPYVFLFLLTAFLVFVYFTIRGPKFLGWWFNSGSKSKS